jgi:hypothetical protein
MYAIEVRSDAMTYLPSYIKIGSGIQKLLRGVVDIRTHRHVDSKVTP